MGVAFLVMYPMLYTDTSDAWRLTSRRQRLTITVAGMVAELGLAAHATLAWSFLPDGPLRSAVFALASTTWILTLVVNLNPCMRFDGYYLAADLLDVPNLQDRAFTLERWWLRELLFGLGEPCPLQFDRQRHRILIAYAVATWIYRFFLFMGIAVLVYHVFFKLLGIFLILVEILWFIVRPIVLELAQWVQRREKLRLNRHTAGFALVLGAIVAAILVPWRATLHAPAVLEADERELLYAPSAARVEFLPRPGQTVQAGDVLVRLASPDLDHRITQASAHLDSLRWLAAAQSVDPRLRERGEALWREREEAEAQLAALQTERARLTLTAPFAGTVVWVRTPLAAGEWIAAREPVVLLADLARPHIETYVSEDELDRIRIGAAGRFYPAAPDLPAVTGRVREVAVASERQIDDAPLTTAHGGPIPVREPRPGVLIPEVPVYRVLLDPLGPVALDQIQNGTAVLTGEPASLAARLWRIFAGTIIRESGF